MCIHVSSLWPTAISSWSESSNHLNTDYPKHDRKKRFDFAWSFPMIVQAYLALEKIRVAEETSG